MPSSDNEVLKDTVQIIRLHRPSGGFLDLMEAALCMNDLKDESGRNRPTVL